MPQKGLIKHDFFLFEGVNAYREGNRNPEDTLYYAQNSRFEGGRWTSRKGHSAFGTVQTGGTKFRGLLTYTRFPSGAETNYVFGYYNSKFYRYELAGGVSTEITPPGTWTGADAVDVEGVSYNGVQYLANGTDRLHKITDTTMAEVTNAPRFRIVEEFGEKIWGVDNVAPATAQYSSTATGGSPLNVETFSGGSSGAQLFGKGGRIESMRKLGKSLYFFKQNSIDSCTGFDISGATPVPLIEPVSKTGGALTHRSTTLVENDIWFLTPDLEVRSLGQQAGFFNDTRTEDMSKVINRYKSNLDPDQAAAVSWYNDGLYKLALKERSSSQNNLLFVYDRDSGFWDFDRGTSQTIATVADGDAYFTVDGTSGTLYKDENAYSDNGFPIAFSGKTNLADDGRPDLSKRSRYVYIRGARSADVTLTVYLLGEDFVRLTGESYTIAAPTAAEIAAASTAVGGLGRAPGDIVGEEGYTGSESGIPPVYRFNHVHSVGSIARMFGVEIVANLTGTRVAIDEIKLKYIPLPDSYHPVDS